MSSSSPRRGVSIRMFLADGTPEGLRLVEKSNWNGLAVMCSRAQYPDVRSRDEFLRPGVYLLYGPSSGGSGQQTIYIGQADVVRNRLDQHHRDREFWTHVILFVSQHGTLNRAHIQYLESRLIEMANRARRVVVENGNAPGLPYLSEADRADAEAFLDEMLLIYPVLGVTAFEVATATGGSTAPEQQGDLRLKTLHTDATARNTAEGFIVLLGSSARANPVPSLLSGYRQIRDTLLASGVFVEQGEHLLLTQDYRFESPSQAACVFAGRAANGLMEWKNDEGRTLRELQSMAVESAANVD